MAESEPTRGALANGAVVSTPRWGTLRLVRMWPAERAADGGVQSWPEESFRPIREWRKLALVPAAEPMFDLRAATLALHQVLTEWRTTERELAGYVEGSLDWFHAQAEIAAFKMAYRRLFDEIRRRSSARQPEPAPSLF
jgi:hypothetical protein